MGGGGGKGGGGGTSGSRALEDISRQLFTETTPLRGDIIGSLQNIITGGAQGRIPIVQRATEETLRAGSQARTDLESFLATTGLARTPFGARAVGEQELAARTATAGVPTELFRQFLPGAQNLVLGTGQTVVSGFGQAAQSQASLAGQRARAEADKLAAIFGATGQIGAARVCWIADALYGVGSRHAELARLWIFHGWRGPTAAVARWAYRRFGKRVAARIDRGDAFGEWLRGTLLLWFDQAVELAKQYLYEEWLRSRPEIAPEEP